MAQQLATPPQRLDLELQGLGTCLRLGDCPDILQTLAAAMPAWPARVREAKGPAPAIRLRREGQGYLQRSPELPRGLYLPTAVSGACSLVADLTGAFFHRHPDLIGLHCGSVEVGGRLLIFPDARRAGKSTLTAAFAAEGQRVFGDDVLALTPDGEGMAMGTAPRLRLPLPEALDPAMRDFVNRHAGPADDRYGYLALSPGRLARHGERLPLGALVLLERDDALAEPEIIPLAAGEGLLQLLCQNFSHDAPSETLMERFLPLMTHLPCLLVRYSEPLDAARRLIDALGEGSLISRTAAVSLARHQRADHAERPALSGGWVARTTVHTYPLGEALFLIHGTSGAIHRLNESGRAVWRLLNEAPLSAREIADLLAEHYGNLAAERIEPDITALMARLADAGLIRRFNDSA